MREMRRAAFETMLRLRPVHPRAETAGQSLALRRHHKSMPHRIRWGILGTGKIAHQFAAALRRLPGAHLFATGSRSAESGARFADEFGISRRYGSYSELVSDSEIDVIYIATP